MSRNKREGYYFGKRSDFSYLNYQKILGNCCSVIKKKTNCKHKRTKHKDMSLRHWDKDVFLCQG